MSAEPAGGPVPGEPPPVAPAPTRFDAEVEVAVVGAGAAGLVAGLRALEGGAETLVVERDPRPAGSTAMSSGFVPAAGTRFQCALGVEDAPELHAADIQRKARGRADPVLVHAATRAIGPALEWLADAHGLPWEVLTGFLYPGHARHRMHAVPERSGAGLMARLLRAAETAGLSIATEARAYTLLVGEDGCVAGVAVERPGGRIETLGCRALVLASCGFGGSSTLVARHIPEAAGAPYYGHPGNQGDALRWGEALGAAMRDLDAWQGHGSLAHPHRILISWALIMAGGIQVNARGERFADESEGYSEQAVRVLGQPGGIAWTVYDERIHRLGLELPDYRAAVAAGAVRTGRDAAALSAATGLPEDALRATLAEVAACAEGRARDRFGRGFTLAPPLGMPLHAVRVTGALFHTQGGLAVDDRARVLGRDGRVLGNLFAAGGAVGGLSGPGSAGYLSGNGLLSAVALGFLAGHAAARAARAAPVSPDARR